MGHSSSKNKKVPQDNDLQSIADHVGSPVEKIKEQQKNFMEKHPDGKVDKKEFGKMMSECFPDVKTEKLEKAMFRMFDQDSNGCIEFQEYVVILYCLSSGTPQENLKQIFRVFDENNDGTISKREMNAVIKMLQRLPTADEAVNTDEKILASENKKELVAQAFEEMDTDADGKITQEEFIQACMSQKAISTKLALNLVQIFTGDE